MVSRGRVFLVGRLRERPVVGAVGGRPCCSFTLAAPELHTVHVVGAGTRGCAALVPGEQVAVEGEWGGGGRIVGARVRPLTAD